MDHVVPAPTGLVIREEALGLSAALSQAVMGAAEHVQVIQLAQLPDGPLNFLLREPGPAGDLLAAEPFGPDDAELDISLDYPRDVEEDVPGGLVAEFLAGQPGVEISLDDGPGAYGGRPPVLFRTEILVGRNSSPDGGFNGIRIPCYNGVPPSGLSNRWVAVVPWRLAPPGPFKEYPLRAGVALAEDLLPTGCGFESHPRLISRRRSEPVFLRSDP